MKINFNETKKMLLRDNSSFLSHLFLDQFCNAIDMDSEEVKAITESDEWTLKMEVNGVTVDNIGINKAIETIWARNFKKMIENRAQELFQNKWDSSFGKIEDAIYEASNIKHAIDHWDWSESTFKE